MEEEEDKDLELRSEEVKEIMGNPPSWIIRWGSTLAFGVVALLFFFAWFIKGYLTTGCFLFPLSATCINNFEWYPTNSTRSMENVTTTSSYGLIEYLNQSIPISEWWSNFITIKINFIVINNFSP